jgi:hypothetical protein
MKTLVNIPGRQNLDIPVHDSKVPKPDEVAYLPAALLGAVIALGGALKDLKSKWAIWGDAGEIIKGVNVKTDHLEILTTKEGCEEICKLLAQNVSLRPAEVERRLPKDADVGGQIYPVYIRSHYSELTLKNIRVEVYGDEQIRVGEWDWGDPLDFEPDYSYVVRERIPIAPLRFREELDLGLGWLDRLELISAAVESGKHHIAEGGGRR